jgi:transcription antitermination factor NusG
MISGRELACVEWWRSRAIEAWTPAGKVNVRKRLARGFERIDRAVFSGYAFIKSHALGGSTYCCAEARRNGFIGILVSANRGPLLMQDSEINMIRQRQTNGDYDDTPPDVQWTFSVGQNVVITVGPFASFPATVKGRGLVEIRLFNGLVTAEMSADMLKVFSAPCAEKA